MAGRDIIVVGGSAGSVEVVARLVRALPRDLPAAVFVAIHFPATAASALPSILSRARTLPARAARSGEPADRGTIYVAPPNCHLTLQDGTVRVARGPKENGHRPAIDPLFRTAAAAGAARVIGVLLSGNGSDGTLGLRRIRDRGGITIAQDPADATYPRMPASAIEHGAVDHVVSAAELPGLLVGLVGQVTVGNETEAAMESDLHPEEGDGERAVAHQDRLVQPGTPSTQTCPECHGTLWEDQDGGVTSFRCRIGHAFTAESLATIQAEELEAALWTALRALEEHAALVRRMAVRASAQQHQRSSSVFTEQALDAEHHAAVIRNVLEDLKLLDGAPEPVGEPEERAS